MSFRTSPNPLFGFAALLILQACYGLRRLLPSQASTLGSSWLAVLHNRNKPISERVQAVIRWTLMPTTDYSSIVNLASDEEVPISLGEALLKVPVHLVRPRVVHENYRTTRLVLLLPKNLLFRFSCGD